MKYGRWLGVKDHDVTRAEDGSTATPTCGRGRSLCPADPLACVFPAGFRRMPLLRFTLLTAAGSLVWNAALIGGRPLGDNWGRSAT